MTRHTEQVDAPWQRGAATVGGFLVLLGWLLQMEELLTLRTAFLCNLAVLSVTALCLPKGVGSRRPWVENVGQAAIFATVFACAIFLRTSALDGFPPDDGQLWEETQTGKVAYDSLRLGSLDPYFPLTNLTGEVGFHLFGVSMRALRLPFVALGIVSVPVFFVASRFFLGAVPSALVTTAFFAFSAYLASASRVALETMAPIFTVCLALALTFRACVQRSASAFALAGIANGLLMLEYFSYKLLPPLLVLCLVGYLLQEGETRFCNRVGGRYSIRRLVEYRGQLLILLGFGGAVAMPIVLLDPSHAHEFFLEGVFRQRVGIEQVSLGLTFGDRLALAGDRIIESMSFLFLRGGQNDIVASSRGVIDLPTGIVGFASLLCCAVYGWRCPGKMFLAGTTVAFVVLSGALVGNPARYRLTPLVPLYLLAIGAALDDFMGWFQARHYRMGALVLGTLALCAWNVRSLAVDVVHQESTRAELYDLPLVIVAEIARLQAKHPGVEIHLVSDFDYLGGVNDYEFLYDPERVRVGTSALELRGARGFVLAHGRYVAEVTEQLEEVSECQSWRTDVGQDVILRCSLGGSPAGSAGEE